MKKLVSAAAVLATALSLMGCAGAVDDRVVGGAALGGATGAIIGGVATASPGGALAGAAIGGGVGALAGAATSPHHPGTPGDRESADDYDHLNTGPARCLREGYDAAGQLVCLRWSDPYYRYTRRESHLFGG